MKILNSLSDKELIDRLLQNDEETIEFFFFQKCSLIFNRIVRDLYFYSVKKEEIITDFYLYLSMNDWQKVRTFSFNSKFLTWVTIVAIRFYTNKKMEMTKKEPNNPLINVDENIGIVDNHFEDIDFQSFSISKYELYDLINNISNSRYRWVLLSELRGWSVEEMAKELKTTVINIYNLKKRAKSALKEMLKQ